MSHNGDSIHSAVYLSWRRLHLSKAKLKAASSTSALLAGFAMIAMVEIQLTGQSDNQCAAGKNETCQEQPPSECSEYKETTCQEPLPSVLLLIFAACTTLLVAVHMLALLISTCILPHMEAVSSLHTPSLVGESPHDKMHFYIELAWACSTVIGILLFMVEVVVLCWVQFFSVSKAAAWVATAILIPFIVVFILFAINFYRQLVGHTYEVREGGIRELERFRAELMETDALTSRDSSFLTNIA